MRISDWSSDVCSSDLDAAITPRTKGLIFNAPSNPTGAAYSRDELKALADDLVTHRPVLNLADDMYEHLVNDDFRFATLGDIDTVLYERSQTIHGPSRRYTMIGSRTCTWDTSV